ncbi:MAG TPA: helix-hairpin-helix domain-containing protein [Bauldia sp.]|nr:helix-hairpin-helix domain-containing protein [Bauldia sp.]
MPRLNATEVAGLLTELSRRSALAGGNPYRARAYARAADAIGTIGTSLDEVIAAGRLRSIEGIGDTIADIVTQLHETGTHPTLEKLRRDVPASVLEMLTVPGLRPDKVTMLYRDLGIRSLAELEAAARADRLKRVKGIGAALQAKIIEGIAVREEAGNARHMNRAADLIAAAQRDLERSDYRPSRVTPAGDFRRSSELVRDISFVVELPEHAGPPETLAAGGLTVTLTDPAHAGAALLMATGSAEHLAELRRLAGAKNMELRPEGLVRGTKVVAAASEADIYRALGLDFIPPELREGRGEIELAGRHRLPVLVEENDLRGILHAHTVASDGVNTLEEMADATLARGYQYFGIADHSRSAFYAGGLSLEEIAEQQAEVARLNRKYGRRFHVFHGIESDILVDGALDYPDDVLAGFDFVVASVHSRFKLDEKKQTERILAAVRHPATTILGHMTGRQLLRRAGYDIDVEAVLAACAEHGVAVEINGNPWRLDLDWRWHRRGLELGCMFSINPDAHSIAEIDLTHWGLLIARKGGIPKEHVLNCLSRAEIEAFFRKRRQRWQR